MASLPTALPSSGISVARWPIFRHPIPAYACALALTAIAFLLRWNLDATLGTSARMIFFMIAAALSAFLFGRGPGIFSTILGVALGDYFFVTPRYSFHFDSNATIIAVVSVVVQGVLISICAGYLHRALRIRAAAEEEMRHLYEAERRAHEAADELNRTKDYFLAVLSHELRGPLSAITYCVADRLHDATVPADLREDFAIIDRNARMQSRLIADLLDLTRISRGRMEIESQPLDLRDLLAEAVRTSATDGERTGPAPTLEYHARQTRIEGDHDRLLQVFWNILRNASKFTPPDGHIEIETRDSTPGHVSIRIRDTGIGLTPEDLERIFHPFEQVGRDTNRKHGGLGLGLAIARGLVELHHGTLLGESAGPGHGTTFIVDFPVVHGDESPNASRDPALESSARSKATEPPVGVA